ncbi:MAG: hypothetical protein SWY16_14400 [Cyanobacteriota bacterium]|nr:hypothetical protein [Cyanobacteriota bacterium]
MVSTGDADNVLAVTDFIKKQLKTKSKATIKKMTVTENKSCFNRMIKLTPFLSWWSFKGEIFGLN